MPLNQNSRTNKKMGTEDKDIHERMKDNNI